MIARMIDIREAPKIIETLNDKLIEHMVNCSKCRPRVRCLQYIILADIKSNLKMEAISDQAN